MHGSSQEHRNKCPFDSSQESSLEANKKAKGSMSLVGSSMVENPNHVASSETAETCTVSLRIADQEKVIGNGGSECLKAETRNKSEPCISSIRLEQVQTINVESTGLSTQTSAGLKMEGVKDKNLEQSFCVSTALEKTSDLKQSTQTSAGLKMEGVKDKNLEQSFCVSTALEKTSDLKQSTQTSAGLKMEGVKDKNLEQSFCVSTALEKTSDLKQSTQTSAGLKMEGVKDKNLEQSFCVSPALEKTTDLKQSAQTSAGLKIEGVKGKSLEQSFCVSPTLDKTSDLKQSTQTLAGLKMEGVKDKNLEQSLCVSPALEKTGDLKLSCLSTQTSAGLKMCVENSYTLSTCDRASSKGSISTDSSRTSSLIQISSSYLKQDKPAIKLSMPHTSGLQASVSSDRPPDATAMIKPSKKKFNPVGSTTNENLTKALETQSVLRSTNSFEQVKKGTGGIIVRNSEMSKYLDNRELKEKVEILEQRLASAENTIIWQSIMISLYQLDNNNDYNY